MYHKIKGKKLLPIYKWLSYALLTAIFFVLQTTPQFLTINNNVTPILILPICFAIAMIEKEFESTLFVVPVGIAWDVSMGAIVGSYTLPLMVIIFLISFLIKIYFKNTLVNFIIISFISLFLLLFFTYIFTYKIFYDELTVLFFFEFLFPICVYSTILSPISYFLIKKLNAFFIV